MADEKHPIRQLQDDVAELKATVAALSVYLPVLQEVFAGKIAGESEAVSEVWSILSNADPETVRTALALAEATPHNGE